jgi:hypothetical protein
MLALVSHVFIWIQNGDIFVSSNHRDVLPSIKFNPLIFFTIDVLPTKKTTYDFSVGNTLIVKKIVDRSKFQCSNAVKFARIDFSHCNWVLMENFSRFFFY